MGHLRSAGCFFGIGRASLGNPAVAPARQNQHR